MIALSTPARAVNQLLRELSTDAFPSKVQELAAVLVALFKASYSNSRPVFTNPLSVILCLIELPSKNSKSLAVRWVSEPDQPVGRLLLSYCKSAKTRALSLGFKVVSPNQPNLK